MQFDTIGLFTLGSGSYHYKSVVLLQIKVFWIEVLFLNVFAGTRRFTLPQISLEWVK
jgi:hypothetical protein